MPITYTRPLFGATYAVTPRSGGKVIYSGLHYRYSEELITRGHHGISILSSDCMSRDEIPGDFADLQIKVPVNPKSPNSYEFIFSIDPQSTKGLMDVEALSFGEWCNSEEVSERRAIGSAIQHLTLRLVDRLETDLLRALIGDEIPPEIVRQRIGNLSQAAITAWGELPRSDQASSSCSFIHTPLIGSLTAALNTLRDGCNCAV